MQDVYSLITGDTGFQEEDMPIRLLAIDLDDTLLTKDLTISDRTMSAIAKARAKGVLVTVATGRMPRSCQKYIEQLEINIPVISCNGAIIRESPGGEIIYRQVIDSKLAAEVIGKMQNEGMHCQIYIKDKIYTNKFNKWAGIWKRQTVHESEEADLLEILSGESEGAEKLVSIDEEEIILLKYKTLGEQFEGRINAMVSKPNFLELCEASVSKGNALAFLAERHGIQKEEVMAIGDSLNDIDMIKYAGLGIAIGNARSEVKKEADYITGTNNEDGVALAIEEFILK